MMMMMMLMTGAGKRSLPARSCRPALAFLSWRAKLLTSCLSPRVLFHKVACNSRYSKQDSVVQSPPPSVLVGCIRERGLFPLPCARRTGGCSRQFEAAPRLIHPAHHEAPLMFACASTRSLSLYDSAMLVIKPSTARHQVQTVDARLAAAAVSGQTAARHRRRSGPTTQVLRANTSNGPVTLSLLSELNQGANKDSRFASLI